MRFLIVSLLPGKLYFLFLQVEVGIRYLTVTGVQTCALPIWMAGDDPAVSYIPPPTEAELPVIMQLMNVGEAAKLYTAPPPLAARLPMKVQLRIVGLPEE